jgi:hypothetical protein
MVLFPDLDGNPEGASIEEAKRKLIRSRWPARILTARA